MYIIMIMGSLITIFYVVVLVWLIWEMGKTFDIKPIHYDQTLHVATRFALGLTIKIAREELQSLPPQFSDDQLWVSNVEAKPTPHERHKVDWSKFGF